MYRSILVGTDGSTTAARAVDRAVEVAAATGARLTIASVGSGHRPQTIVAAEAARVEAASPLPEVQTITAVGDPASGLMDLAGQGDYDLLVVGNKGMTGAARFFGSVPNKVSHHAAVAILIVRTT